MRAMWALILAAGMGTGVAKAGDLALDLPSGYKTEFDNYLVSDRLGQEDQVISLFANDVARTGARSDGKLPSGSVLIGEIYEAKMDADGTVIESLLGRRVPAKLKAIVMMERREGWDDQYSQDVEVGDWAFEVFSPEGKNLGKDTTACRECHQPLSDTEYTFSYAHLGAAN